MHEIGRARGLTRARLMLADRPAAVPNPPPLAYGLVATSAREINACKGRPLDQNVGVSVHDRSEWRRVAASIDLSAAHLDSVQALLALRLTLLLPMHPSVVPPAWVLPGIRAGHLAAFDGWWAPTSELWDQFPRLYGSSANLTGQPPLSSADAVRRVFGARCSVIEVDAPGPAAPATASSTILRIDRTGRLHLHRSGAHDRLHPRGIVGYLQETAAAVGLPTTAAHHQPHTQEEIT